MADGLDAFLSRPFAQNLWGRRTHRVSRGSNVDAKSMISRRTRARRSASRTMRHASGHRGGVT
jgi:hypothetical protein